MRQLSFALLPSSPTILQRLSGRPATQLQFLPFLVVLNVGSLAHLPPTKLGAILGASDAILTSTSTIKISEFAVTVLIASWRVAVNSSMGSSTTFVTAVVNSVSNWESVPWTVRRVRQSNRLPVSSSQVVSSPILPVESVNVSSRLRAFSIVSLIVSLTLSSASGTVILSSAVNVVETVSVLVMIGLDDGTSDGLMEGETDGTSEGATDGTSEGAIEGATDGTSEGAIEGATDGPEDGSKDGSAVGSKDGSEDGSADGSEDGSEDGSADGSEDGAADGSDDGAADGSEDGSEDG